MSKVIISLQSTNGSSNLSFIAISKDPNCDKEKPLIDYNVEMLRNTLLQVLDYV